MNVIYSKCKREWQPEKSLYNIHIFKIKKKNAKLKSVNLLKWWGYG